MTVVLSTRPNPNSPKGKDWAPRKNSYFCHFWGNPVCRRGFPCDVETTQRPEPLHTRGEDLYKPPLCPKHNMNSVLVREGSLLRACTIQASSQSSLKSWQVPVARSAAPGILLIPGTSHRKKKKKKKSRACESGSTPCSAKQTIRHGSPMLM